MKVEEMDPSQGRQDDLMVRAWIEEHVGPVTRFERQGRWRPAWFVDAGEGSDRQALYVRGARGGKWPAMPLQYEARFQDILRENGVKVPRIHGFIEDVPAIVMERMPGRANMATADCETDKVRLREQLADEMLKIHRVDPASVVAAGAPLPASEKEVTVSYFRQMERLYLSNERLPAPDIAFARQWIDQNIPPCVEGPAVITVDAGQFIFEGGNLTSMLDFELGTVGDRHVDFAALKTRNRFEEIGDLEEFFDLYHRRGGIALDRSRIQFHRVCFTMATPLQIAHEMVNSDNHNVYFEYMKWHCYSMNDVFAEIAANADLTLTPVDIPESVPNMHSLLLESLRKVIGEIGVAHDEHAKFQQFNLSAALNYLSEYYMRSSAYEDIYLSRVCEIVGTRSADFWQADLALQEYIEAAKPGADERILNLLHWRNTLRYRIFRMTFEQGNLTPWLND